MLRIGEESGSLDETLSVTNDFYSEELNIKIEKLMDNSSLQGAIITLPSLVIMFLIVIILKYIKDDILKVISSYAEIDEDGLEIKMSKTRSETDDKPVSALVANIPLKNIKERKI